MKIGKNYTVAFKRKRQSRTDYRQRLHLIQSGKSRFVVRRMLNNITIQIVNFSPQGDKTALSAHSRDLLEYGWKAHRGNLPAAYLTGFLAGLKAKKVGITQAILDLGLAHVVPGSAFFAAVKGASDAGLTIPHDPASLPADARFNGTTIAAYGAQRVSGSLQFSRAEKNGLPIKDLPTHLNDVKQKITQQWK